MTPAGTLPRTAAGRDREPRAARQALAAAREGRGGIMLLTGEGGAGRSRLLAAAATLAAMPDRVVPSTFAASADR